jgi:hypothetical protein
MRLDKMNLNNSDGSTSSEFVEPVQIQTQKDKQPSPELEAVIDKFVKSLVDQVGIPSNDILERATPRWEYRRCSKGREKMSNKCLTCTFGPPYCQGPYLYLYWKEKGKLKKKYVGRDPENLNKKLMSKIEEYGRML